MELVKEGLWHFFVRSNKCRNCGEKHQKHVLYMFWRIVPILKKREHKNFGKISTNICFSHLFRKIVFKFSAECLLALVGLFYISLYHLFGKNFKFFELPLTEHFGPLVRREFLACSWLFSHFFTLNSNRFHVSLFYGWKNSKKNASFSTVK